MGAPADLKLMNTHLHLLEAMTTFYRASKLPLARERLLELINIESNTVVRKNLGACTDKYEPRLDAVARRRLCPRLLRPRHREHLAAHGRLRRGRRVELPLHGPVQDAVRVLAASTATTSRSGGFFYTGRFNAPADDRSKSWWVQAEAIVSSLRMYEYTKDPKYLAVFESTFELIETKLVDWEVGEWHREHHGPGTAAGRQGQPLEGRLSQRPGHDRMHRNPQGMEELTGDNMPPKGVNSCRI